MKFTEKHLNILLMLILSILLLEVTAECKSQEIKNDSLESEIDEEDSGKNTVFFELLGNGIYYSLGYDRVIYQKNENGVSVSMGLTYFPHNTYNSAYISPQINYFKGNIHKLELGLGYTLEMDYIDNPMKVVEPKFLYTNFIFVRIGYRYQNPKNGLFFKGGFLLFRTFATDARDLKIIIAPWAGIAVGKSF